MRFEKLHNVRVFLGATLEPGKRLFLVTESQVGVEKRCRRDVTGCSSSVKFVENPQRIGTAAGAGVGTHENSQDSRAAVREGRGSLQSRDRFVEMFSGNESKAEKPGGHRILGFDRERSTQFPDGLFIAATVKENPPYLSAVKFLGVEFLRPPGGGKSFLRAGLT